MTRSLLLTTALSASAALAPIIPAKSQPAPNARPTGGVVVAGVAGISHSATTTNVKQSSQRAAINWQSFNVGSRQTVEFSQPSTQAVILNRVVGPDPSGIAGRIDANGQVIISNRSGIVFYKGAQVNAGGLVATAAGISNQNFMAGRMIFDKPARPGARVENHGQITIKQTGLAALVAPQVANAGVITARLGHVVLAGAKTATLDLYGDGLISLDVNNEVTQVPQGKSGKSATALVTNSGTIIADGGTVQLTARAADGIIQNLVDARGQIRTATAGTNTGTVTLNGIGGDIVIAGQIAAAGTSPGARGGTIAAVTDGDVTVSRGARLDASGEAGGGVVAIGTTMERARGGPSVSASHVARNVTVQRGAAIEANAISNGDGGHVTLLSDNSTQMDGSITAEGGAQGGNGGFIETSGKYLGVTGSVNLLAPHDERGTWLLDPDFLTVTGGPQDPTFSGTVSANGGMPQETISNSTINSSEGNVLLQAAKTLAVDANISLGYFQDLTLYAGNDLLINNKVNVIAGNVTLATGNASLLSPSTAAGFALSSSSAQATPMISIRGTVTSPNSVNIVSDSAGGISIAQHGSVGAPFILINAGSAGVTLSESAIVGQPDSLLGQAGSAASNPHFLDISSTGTVNEPAGGTILADNLTSTSGLTGNVSLLGISNVIGTIGNFGSSLTVTNGDLTVVDSSDLALFGSISANNLFFKVANPGGTLSLGGAGGDFFEPANLAAATNGRISLVADVINNAASGNSLDTNGGVVALAPDSSLPVSVQGTGGFAIPLALLSIIDTGGGTLALGGVTQIPPGVTGAARSASSISIDAPTDLTNIASTLQLDATGTLSQPGGILTVGTLAGDGGAWAFNNPGNILNAIGNINATSLVLANSRNLAVQGSLAVNGGATITTPGTLSVPGSMTAGRLFLTGGAIEASGLLNAGTLDLYATGGSIDATGPLSIGTLTGNATGDASLTGQNAIGVLDGFSAANFALNATADLVIGGTLSAGNITIRAPASRITLGDGATIITDGSTRPKEPLPTALEPSNGGPGSFLQAAGFTQVGSSTVLGQQGGPATLEISVTGNMQFDPPLGLQADNTWLILNLTGGSALGQVYVGALDVSHTSPGSTSLTGSVAGVATRAAAVVASIEPGVDTSYKFNGCVIDFPICSPLIVGTQAIIGAYADFLSGLALPLLPQTPKLNLLTLSFPALSPESLTPQDVVPPNISAKDY